MTKDKLRVGLLLDDYQVPAWQLTMFEQIAAAEYAEIVLVVLNDNSGNTPNNTLQGKLLRNRNRLLQSGFEKLLDKIYHLLIERHHSVADANAKVDCKPLLGHIDTLHCIPEQTRWSDRIAADDIESIAGYQTDVLIRCGFRILRGEILNTPRFGVWSYHHGDNTINRGGPPGFWESMESWPVSGSVLQILTEDLDNGKVLYRSFTSTNSMSVQDNRSRNNWKSLTFVPRKLKELYDNGPETFFERVAAENRHPKIYSEKLYVKPTNMELAGLLFHKVLEKAVNLYRNNFYLTQWILMFDIREEFSSSLWRYKKILPPKDRFYADPHIVRKDGLWYIFIEEYIFGSNRGFISVINMDDNGHYSEPQTVLERPYHLSYPFVFEHDGEYYMVPETQANRTIEMYKCVEFPHRWELHKTLMEDIRAGDATLHFQDGRWWMFATVSEIRGVSLADELWLFSAEDLFSNEWQAHPNNPVVSDCRNARPAGTLFTAGDRLYRPAQNCSYRYGYGFNLNEVTQLSETTYAETTVTQALPNWDKRVLGTHTFSRNGHLHVIDASYRRNRWGKR